MSAYYVTLNLLSLTSRHYDLDIGSTVHIYYCSLVDTGMDMAPCLHIIAHMDLDIASCLHIIAHMEPYYTL